MRLAAKTTFLGNKDTGIIRSKTTFFNLTYKMIKFCRYIYINQYVQFKAKILSSVQLHENIKFTEYFEKSKFFSHNITERYVKRERCLLLSQKTNCRYHPL